MNITGKIKAIQATETYGNFNKRLLVVTTDEKYPQHIGIEFHNEKADLLNSYNVGDTVNVSINVRGKEWTSPQGQVKYFNSLVGWKIEGDAIPNKTPQEAFTPSKDIKSETVKAAESLSFDDDLPFNLELDLIS